MMEAAPDMVVTVRGAPSATGFRLAEEGDGVRYWVRGGGVEATCRLNADDACRAAVDVLRRFRPEALAMPRDEIRNEE